MTARHEHVPHTALFKMATRGESSIDLEGVTSFLEQAMMVGQSVSDSPFCSLHAVDVCARECFRKVRCMAMSSIVEDDGFSPLSIT